MRPEMKIHRTTLDTCSKADGVVIVIDVLRAFTTAAHAFAKGVEEILLVSTVEEAFELRARYPECLLVGEVDGLPVDGFDLWNSPSALESIDLASRRLIQRTTAGTQGVVRSIRADTLLVASLCVALPTSDYIKRLDPEAVTFVETGVRATGGGEEDVVCADYIAGLLLGIPTSQTDIRSRVLSSEAARKFADDQRPDFPKSDLEYALMIDCFDFAMEVRTQNQLRVLKAVPNQLA